MFHGAPILQVFGYLRVDGEKTERYRALLSDGEHMVATLLASRLNHLITSGALSTFATIKVDNYTSTNENVELGW